MSDVRPFRALRPRDDLAGEIIAPPYDVLTDAECRDLARNPKNFVHVTRSEVDLPVGADSHSDAAYQKAAENLRMFVKNGWLQPDREETYYLYAQTMGTHRQTCILAGASVAEYDRNLIAKHEYTRPDKEDDRTHHMDVLDAQVGLVFLAYNPTARLSELVARAEQAPAAWTVTTEDDVVHELRVVPVDMVEDLRQAFAELPKLYICDGHHRSAAASRIDRQRNSPLTKHFLAGLFPADQLRIMAYNRQVKDLNGIEPGEFVARLKSSGWDVTEGGPATPGNRGEISMYFQGKWSTLTPQAHLRSDDPVAGLDVSILQDNLLAPILGIQDPRRSSRIEFVGGIRGPEALVKAVDSGAAAVAFSMYPTGMDQLFKVADADQVMPPKSTWFEPKLREGVVVRALS